MLAPCKEGIPETVLKHGIPSARPLDESAPKRLGNGGPRGASFGRRNRGGRAAASGRYRWPPAAELPLHSDAPRRAPRHRWGRGGGRKAPY